MITIDTLCPVLCLNLYYDLGNRILVSFNTSKRQASSFYPKQVSNIQNIYMSNQKKCERGMLVRGDVHIENFPEKLWRNYWKLRPFPLHIILHLRKNIYFQTVLQLSWCQIRFCKWIIIIIKVNKKGKKCRQLFLFLLSCIITLFNCFKKQHKIDFHKDAEYVEKSIYKNVSKAMQCDILRLMFNYSNYYSSFPDIYTSHKFPIFFHI